MRRLRNYSIGLAASLAFFTAPTLSAQESASAPITLDGATPWNVDYADNSCALMRGFGEDDQRVLVEFRQFAPGSLMRVMFASSVMTPVRDTALFTLAPEDPRQVEGIERLRGEGEDPIEGFFFNFALASNLEEAGLFAESDDARDAREREIYGIQLGEVYPDTYFLRTGDLHAPMEALRTCMNDLLSSWGVAMDALRRNTRAVTPIDLERWADRIRNHYPRTGRNREIGLNVTVLVNPEGRVSRCVISNALTNEDFEAVACAALTEYARFEPALDADGEPTFGFWSTRIFYLKA